VTHRILTPQAHPTNAASASPPRCWGRFYAGALSSLIKFIYRAMLLYGRPIFRTSNWLDQMVWSYLGPLSVPTHLWRGGSRSLIVAVWLA
jgi:hypothetical protein